jgi:hypothetical protein
MEQENNVDQDFQGEELDEELHDADGKDGLTKLAKLPTTKPKVGTAISSPIIQLPVPVSTAMPKELLHLLQAGPPASVTEETTQQLMQAVAVLHQQNQQLASRVEVLSQHAARHSSGTAHPVFENWEWDPQIAEILTTEPIDRPHFTTEAFIEQMNSLPDVAGRKIKSDTQVPGAMDALSPNDRMKFNWYPHQEVMWAQQLRVSAFLADMLTKMQVDLSDALDRAKDDPNQGVEELEIALDQLNDAVITAWFNMLSVSGATRKIATDKLKLIAVKMGAHPSRFEEPDPNKAELLSKARITDIAGDRKARQLVQQATRYKPKRAGNHQNTSFTVTDSVNLFGRGAARGHSSSRYQHQGRFRGNGRYHPYHNSNRGNQSSFRGRGRGRGNNQGQSQGQSSDPASRGTDRTK